VAAPGQPRAKPTEAGIYEVTLTVGGKTDVDRTIAIIQPDEPGQEKNRGQTTFSNIKKGTEGIKFNPSVPFFSV